MKIKDAKQLTLEIDEARSGADGQPQTNEQLIKHIIKLYADEFIKANDEIARLNAANDELFKLKQKVVIANRELIRKNAALQTARDTHRGALEAIKPLIVTSVGVGRDFALEKIDAALKT